MIKQRMGLAVSLLVLVGGVYADSDAGQKDMQKLQGTWLYTSMNVAGMKLPPKELKRYSIRYKGNHWTTRQDGKVSSKGTQKLDPSKTPHQIDAPITDGEGKGLTMLGIYRFKDGAFEVCFDVAGKRRPTSFEPKQGQFTAVLKHVKK